MQYTDQSARALGVGDWSSMPQHRAVVKVKEDKYSLVVYRKSKVQFVEDSSLSCLGIPVCKERKTQTVEEHFGLNCPYIDAHMAAFPYLHHNCHCFLTLN